MADNLSPTDEQQEIIDVFATEQDEVIEALAGTGKSTTLRLLGQSCYPDRQGTVIAFNRAVADEMKSKMPMNVQAFTGHALAFRVVGRDYEHKLGGPFIQSKDIAEYLGIKQWFRVPDRGRKDISSWRIAAMARETVQCFCRSDDATLLPYHVPFVEGVSNMGELRAVVLPYAQRIWDEVSSVEGGLRFKAIGGRGDDAYMKIWALGDPRLYGDFAMVDESQDTNGVLAGVLRRQTHLQRVFVGDSRQRLFDWRGSVDIMSEFSKDAAVLSLTQSFRFGDAVAEEANRWLSYLDTPLRVRGLDSIDSELRPVEQPDAILCRTNADVIDQALRAQNQGVPVAIVGGSDEILTLASAAEQLQRAGKTSHPELSVFKTWADVLSYVEEEKPGGSFGTMMKLINRYGTKRVIEIASRCVPEADADRVIATVHKVKGLEWPTVAVDGGVAPGGQDGDHEPTPADFMVSYVAVTRAQQALDTTAIEYFHRRRQMAAEFKQRRDELREQQDKTPAAAGKQSGS